MQRILFFLGLCMLAQAARAQLGRLEIQVVSGNVFEYTTYKLVGESPFPANGLYIVTPQGAALLDTPWDTTQCLPLLDSIRRRHGVQVSWAISTHSHDDRTGSVGILRRRGVATWCTAATQQRCRDLGEAVPEFAFTNDTVFDFGGTEVHTFDPGPGHAPDNIVLWLPSQRILHGGCLVKSTSSSGLGNLADADVNHWAEAIKAVQSHFPKARYVVPGHQQGLDPKALRHTLHLLRRHQRMLNPYR